MKKFNKKAMHECFSAYITNRSNENLEKIYIEYKNLVYSIAYSILKDNEDSEEIVQNVFIKLHRISTNQLPIMYEASWLYKITKNESINLLKKKKATINIEEIYNISDKHEEISKIIENENFNFIISKLPSKEKEIISLKLISDLSFNQISNLLNMPLGTVEWKYYKSLTNLKNIINSFIIFLISTLLGTSRNIRKEKEFKEKTEFSKEENIQSNETNMTNTTSEENNIIDSFADRKDIPTNEIEEITKELPQEVYKMDNVTKRFFLYFFYFSYNCIYKFN